ncbi:hypothetical protein C9F11_01845 [Streptomyces sp. YIM 121038]|uniref:hypothetical protein n=1 Tax=Streptomyces sp. YIM 121038 TaxID=2136401 RepID=UPI00111065DF|nr:hypothetical protein [Streptomyces sp. YIM 121038]QCX74072.1 hypothetical protein C9F11_01845 [Streptomyces sp. YIM 121038]
MEEQEMHHPPNPPAPVIDSPGEKSTVTDPREPITGTADSPSDQVSIKEGATLLGTTPVFGNTWTYTPETDWTEGTHWVSATASYRARFDHHYGDIYSKPTHVTFDAAIPQRVAVPVISTPSEGSTVTVLREQVTGTAEPGVERVTLAEGGTSLPGEAPVTDTMWAYTPSVDWAPGPHAITATAHRGLLKSPPSAPRHFSVQAPSPTVSVDLVDPLADRQAEQVNYAFTHELDVRITENDVAVRSLPITFTINGSTGSEFDTGAATYPSRTDDQGVAPATTLYAGDTPGDFTVTVTSPERADVRKDIHLTVQPRS